MLRFPSNGFGRGTPAGENTGGGGGGTPAWLSALTANTWTQIGFNTIQDVNPAQDATINPSGGGTNNAPWTATTGGGIGNILSDVCNEWSGAIWDEANKRLWVIAGGHGGYKGNEGYSQYLGANNPAWIRRGYPSGSLQKLNPGGFYADGANSSLLLDGRPHQVHTYNLLCPDGSGNVILLPSGFQWSGGATGNGYKFKDGTDDWDTTVAFAAPSGAQAGCGCLDPVSGRVFAFLNSTVCSFHPTTGARTDHFTTSGNWTGYYCHMVYDSLRQIMVVFSGGIQGGSFASVSVAYFDPASPTAFTITTQSAGVFAWGTRGICYDSDADQYLVWDGGASFITITPPATNPGSNTWVHSTLTPSGTPSTKASNGTRGRLRYSPSLKVAMLLNQTTEKTWVVKLH